MKVEDEAELHRLCDILKKIDADCESPEDCEALAKAALALHHCFIHGKRPEIEAQYDSIGKALSVEQRQHLMNLGIEICDPNKKIQET